MSSKIPRYLFYVATLGILVAIIILSMFYIQYRWLADEIVQTSSSEHQAFLSDSFERRARSQLHAVADRIAEQTAAIEATQSILQQALNDNSALLGLRYVHPSGASAQAGSLPAEADSQTDTLWLEHSLLLSYVVQNNAANMGTVTGSFRLEQLFAESSEFASSLENKEIESRRVSYIWIGAGTLLTLLLCGSVVWLIARDQHLRIKQLKEQAEKLRDADFGEPLPADSGDELSELAAVFNDMRDKLRTTTISRDYVDSLFSGMNEAIIVTSEDGIIKRINAATTQLLGYSEDDLVGHSLDYIVNLKKSASIVQGPHSGLPKEAFFETLAGETVPVSYTSSAIAGTDGEPGDRIYAAQNITERRRTEKRIRYLAQIDALTKIPNRMQFQHLLQRSIARARRVKRTLCLFYVDIDYFKEINDTFGHLAGDTTLETVAKRLTDTLPKRSIVGRLAGDEFAVIIEGKGSSPANKEETSDLAQEVLNRLADPFFVQGHEVFMTASLGIAYYPKDAPNVIDLIRNADAALYDAKKSGGNVYSFYSPKMKEANVDRLMTKSKLKRAFERDELLVHYQPKYNLATGEIFGAEALVRWELPERGMVLPADFIPIAEETNLIIEIGEWVLDKVCEDFRSWQQKLEAAGHVSVNLSLKQLRQHNFISRISSIMRNRGVSPTCLELEITETTLMENPERTIRLLDQLYGLGLNLAIDDFGTGYSSLSALQQFPISTLKIDQSFVRNIVNSPEDATIVDTIIQMGRNLHLDVVAEGVEEESQLNFLQTLGCTYVQGLLFGDPMSSADYVDLLTAQADGTDQHRALFG